ncbi:MAG: LamG domain-containing protein, partial [Planctomycetota bacterium]
MYRKLFLFIVVLALAGTNVAFGQIVWEGRISSGDDDYEQYVSNGDMDSGSSDLEITEEGDPGSNQLIGLRFNGVVVPHGAIITNAYVQFHVDETDVPADNRPGTKFLRGEAVDNAAPFLDVAYNVSSRPTTSAEASWDWPEWLTTHEEGPDQRTSDISAVIQEITDRPGWASGNSMVLIITGSGENTAEAFDGEPTGAALLHIEFISKSASNPTPADGSVYEDTWVTLAWTPGETAASHDVYFSDSFADVNDGAADAFAGNTTSAFFMAGSAPYPYPDGLVPGTTYYWRIDEVEADGTTKYRGPVWSFLVPPVTAYAPDPPDGARFVDPDVTLSWSVGLGGKLHTVYFGDNFDDVNNATGGTMQGTLTYTPGTLERDKTYYWRVDEIDPPFTHKGNVWSFKTLPIIAITDPDLLGWWKFDEGRGDIAVDWSGHENDGQLGGDPEWVDGIMGGALDLTADYVSIDAVANDVTNNTITLSAWIKTTQGGEGNVFASNTGGGHVLLFGIDNGNIYVDDGPSTDWPPTVNDNQWHMITLTLSGTRILLYTDGVEVASITTSIDITAETRWSIGQEWDSTPSDFYFGMVDDARFYHVALDADQVRQLMRGDLLVAWEPSPTNGSTAGIFAATTLTWSPGDNAAQHDVYFGTDIAAVDAADASDTTGVYRGRQGLTSYTPPEDIQMNTGPYYWRIDEFNTDGTISTGSVWSFTVGDYGVVEDFESYNDILAGQPGSNLVYVTWRDGFDNPAINGSTMGYPTGPSMETVTVHGGRQSAPVMYNNVAVSISEVTRTFAVPQNWTSHGLTTLSLWFHGAVTNMGGQMYARVNGVEVVYAGDLGRPAWQVWNIDLASFGAN